MNYLNQKCISINKDEVQKMYNTSKNSNEGFLHSLSWEQLLPITRQLNGNEFKVWLYCMKWTGKDEFYFSPASLERDFNISESTAQRAFKRLKDLEYLKYNSSNGKYIFCPLGGECSQNE